MFHSADLLGTAITLAGGCHRFLGQPSAENIIQAILNDNITIIKDGKFIQKGSPDKLYESPENLYVGKMIGSPEMNIIKAKIDNKNIELPFGNLSTTDERKVDPNFTSTDLMFGIRPNDISISKKLW